MKRRFLFLGLAMGMASLAGEGRASELQAPPPLVAVGKGKELGDAYLACGCGCCGGMEPLKRCVEDKEALERLKAKDKAQAQSPSCHVTGCSIGVMYRICVP